MKNQYYLVVNDGEKITEVEIPGVTTKKTKLAIVDNYTSQYEEIELKEKLSNELNITSDFDIFVINSKTKKELPLIFKGNNDIAKRYGDVTSELTNQKNILEVMSLISSTKATELRSIEDMLVGKNKYFKRSELSSYRTAVNDVSRFKTANTDEDKYKSVTSFLTVFENYEPTRMFLRSYSMVKNKSIDDLEFESKTEQNTETKDLGYSFVKRRNPRRRGYNAA